MPAGRSVADVLIDENAGVEWTINVRRGLVTVEQQVRAHLPPSAGVEHLLFEFDARRQPAVEQTLLISPARELAGEAVELCEFRRRAVLLPDEFPAARAGVATHLAREGRSGLWRETLEVALEISPQIDVEPFILMRHVPDPIAVNADAWERRVDGKRSHQERAIAGGESIRRRKMRLLAAGGTAESAVVGKPVLHPGKHGDLAEAIAQPDAGGRPVRAHGSLALACSTMPVSSGSKANLGQSCWDGRRSA